MNIRSVACVFFSPTGGTKTIVNHIARGVQAEQIELIDVTKRSIRNGSLSFAHDQLVIIGTPVYYGRVPEEVAPFLRTINADNTPCVCVAVYGNRAYDDALLELCDISEAQGFRPAAAGAFIAEHSYSLPSRPIAHDRPDGSDLEKAREFGKKIREKIEQVERPEDIIKINTPGDRPYLTPTNLEMIKQARNVVSLTPETDLDKCTQCGLCVDMCPTGAIDPEDVSKVNKWDCMICFACIKHCPAGAKQMGEPNFNEAIYQLHLGCQEKKEPEIYL